MVLVKLGEALRCIKGKRTRLVEGLDRGGAWLKGTMASSNGERRGNYRVLELLTANRHSNYRVLVSAGWGVNGPPAVQLHYWQQPLGYRVQRHTTSYSSYRRRTLGTLGATPPFSGQTGRSFPSAGCPRPSCGCRGRSTAAALEGTPSCSGC